MQFEQQVELLPNRANPHDSLGDGYYAAGRLVDAREAYRAALKIDPDFSSSKKNLARVEKELRR